MAYMTVGEYELYIGRTLASTEQTLTTTRFIPEATKEIEEKAGFTFEAVEEARLLDAVQDTGGLILFFRTWSASVPTVVTLNAVPITEFTMLGKGPYWGLEILGSSGDSWGNYGEDPQEAISVTSKWGYSETPPPDIISAVVMFVQGRLRNRSGSSQEWSEDLFNSILRNYPAFKIAF